MTRHAASGAVGPPQVGGASQGEEQVICFQLAGQEFAIPIAAVKETIGYQQLTRLPLCPGFFAGLINLRGDVVVVLDLRRLLDLEGPERSSIELPDPADPFRDQASDPRMLWYDRRRIILLRGAVRGTSGHSALCGLLVDRLTQSRRIPLSSVRPPPPSIKETSCGWLRGVTSVRAERGEHDGAAGDGLRSLLLIDLARLLSNERLVPFRRVERERSKAAADIE